MAYLSTIRQINVLYGPIVDIPAASNPAIFLGDEYHSTDTSESYVCTYDGIAGRAWIGIGLAAGNSGLVTSYLGGAKVQTRSTAVDLVCDTAGIADYIVGVTDVSALRTITLPAPSAGRVIVVKDQSGTAAANTIVVVSPVGTIDGAASYVISSNYGSRGFYSDGANWFAT